jgi:hypothetical protein
MTKRITISLPDDVAAFVEQAGADNVSGYVADVLRRRMRVTRLRQEMAVQGLVITDDDIERSRQRLAALPPISDEKHAANLTWLAQFDNTVGDAT